MIKNILGGVAIGIANIIPGVSGGTFMVILGLFDKIIQAVSDVFKIKNPNRMKDIFFLVQILVGAVVGLVAFANVLDWLFAHFATQTLFWFSGLIAFSIPTLLKTELKGYKLSIVPAVIGAAIVIGIVAFSPVKQEIEITVFPALSVILLVKLFFTGALAGGTMLMPGVSGSMVLLIVGQYYLIKSYIASVLDFDLVILIPLAVMSAGIAAGLLISAKLTSYFLKEHRGGTVSFILGLVGASALALYVFIPADTTFTPGVIVSSIVAFIIGAILIVVVERLGNKSNLNN